MSVKRLGKGLEALIRSDQDKENSKHNLLKAETESISKIKLKHIHPNPCLLYTSPSPRDRG